MQLFSHGLTGLTKECDICSQSIESRLLEKEAISFRFRSILHLSSSVVYQVFVVHVSMLTDPYVVALFRHSLTVPMLLHLGSGITIYRRLRLETSAANILQ